MRFVIFDRQRLGLLEGERVLDLASAAGGTPVLSSLASLIEAGEKGLDLVRSVADQTRNSDHPKHWLATSAVTLHAPWPGQQLALAGVNNADHVASAFTNMGAPQSADDVRKASREGSPSGFWGTARPVMGPDAQIEIPSRAGDYFDFEGEPGIVLGKRGKDIEAANFSDFVWGVTLIIDWSIREPVWPPGPMHPFMCNKNFDCSKSVGPCIVVDELDPQDIQIETLVNGVARQNFGSRDMIFSFAEIVEHLSRDFTLHPGDVISGGTGVGTAMDQTVPNDDGTWPTNFYLKPGDRVEVRSKGIGSLVNTIVPKSV